jgi:hypothetical protein
LRPNNSIESRVFLSNFFAFLYLVFWVFQFPFPCRFGFILGVSVRCYDFAFDSVGDFAETHNGGYAKRAHDVHSAPLGGGDCWGFGWVGMETQMGQDFGLLRVQGRFASVNDHHLVVYVFPFDSEFERLEVSAAQLRFLDHR